MSRWPTRVCAYCNAARTPPFSSVVNARRDVASSYLRLGETWLRKAEQSKQPSDWQQARQWFQRSRDEWQELKQRGALPKKDESELDKIAREIAKCEAALKP